VVAEYAIALANKQHDEVRQVCTRVRVVGLMGRLYQGDLYIADQSALKPEIPGFQANLRFECGGDPDGDVQIQP